MADNSKQKVSRRKAIKFASLGAIASAMGVGSASANSTGAGRTINILVDFPDSDYGEMMMQHADQFRGMRAELLMRRAAFVDRKGQIPEIFARVYPHERRAEVVSQSAVVVTPCVKTVMASIKAGAVPVYVRHDHAPHGIEEDMTELGVSVVDLAEQDSLRNALKQAKS